METTIRKIVEYLDKYDFKHSLAGYRYLCSAIQLGSHTPHRLMLSDLYENVAAHFDTTGVTVERSIRYLLKSSSIEIGSKEFLARAIDSLYIMGFEEKLGA